MEALEAKTNVRAQPETVWDVLTDFAHYPNWNPYITALSGEPQCGVTLRATYSELEKRPRTFRSTVTAVEPMRRLVWRRSLVIRGLLDVQDEFRLLPHPSGTTFAHRQCLRGALSPLFRRSFGRAHDALAEMTMALSLVAEACEGGADPLVPRECEWVAAPPRLRVVKADGGPRPIPALPPSWPAGLAST